MSPTSMDTVCRLLPLSMVGGVLASLAGCADTPAPPPPATAVALVAPELPATEEEPVSAPPASPLPQAAAPGEEKPDAGEPPELVLPPPGAPLLAFEGDDDEVELFSAPITALPCALSAAREESLEQLPACSPSEAPRHGFAVLDPEDKGVFLLKEEALCLYELEHGFGGSMDLSGTIIGTRGGLPVVEPEEYSIQPRPKPGAFKGCL